jgi:purine-nucleoside/S-methyl-5'-thioadenosine phosphorylase / adenosine deaminase
MTAPAATTAAALSERAGLPVLTWPVFDALPVETVVTTRHGGVSAGRYATLNLSFAVGDEAANVRENRRRAAAALGAAPGSFVFAAQVHGSRAVVVSAADRGRGALAADDAVEPADALVTAEPGTALAILVADCVPIVLYDPAAHVLACVHAGWRGTVARVAQAALAAMGTLGTRPRDVIAGIGPSVAPGSYQVGEDVTGAARDAFGERAQAPAGPAGGCSTFQPPTGTPCARRACRTVRSTSRPRPPGPARACSSATGPSAPAGGLRWRPGSSRGDNGEPRTSVSL